MWCKVSLYWGFLECAPSCSTCLVLFGQNKAEFPLVCWSWDTHSPLVPAGPASETALQGLGCWLWVTRCYWERDKELKEDVGHIFFKFFVAYAL